YTNNSTSNFPVKQYSSTNRRPNLKFLVKKYLSYFFATQTYCPRKVAARYFNRLACLLLDKYEAISHRIANSKFSIRQTTTFIRFAFQKQGTYLGFYLRCNNSDDSGCTLPSPCVFSANRWRCPLPRCDILPFTTAAPKPHFTPRLIQASVEAQSYKH